MAAYVNKNYFFGSAVATSALTKRNHSD